jgi:5-aminolevulinate synthase
MDKLVLAVDQIFTELGINRLKDWKQVGGRAGVGMTDGPEEAHVDPMWTDAQLGLLDGTTPRTLRNGEKAVVNGHAAAKARMVFNPLLGPISGPIQATRKMQAATAPSKARQKLPVMKTGGGVPLNGDIPIPPPSVAVSA